MRKFLWAVLAGIAVYAAVIIIYFTHRSVGMVPEAYRGTPADPATFMTPALLETVQKLANTSYIAYFLSAPVEWGVLLLLLILGVSGWFRGRAEALSRFSFPQMAVYAFLLQLTLQILEWPLQYYFFHLDHVYGLSSQPFGSWMLDILKGFGVGLIMTVPVAWLVFALMRKSPRRWWLWGWLVSIPISVFFMFIQPVLLDPLFNDFKPLQNQELRTEILQLAKQAGIPADQVYEVDKSKQTNTLNAYVNGIGSTARIVLWDTTLQKMDKNEILFVMAHEMGHYVKKHMLWSLLYSVVESLAGFWLIYRLYHWMGKRYGRRLHIKGPYDLAGIPLLMLLMSFMSFFVSPLDQLESRIQEHSADAYAVQLRHDPEAGVRAFQTLAVEGKSEVYPPALVRIFLDSHPPLADRIDFIRRSGTANGAGVRSIVK